MNAEIQMLKAEYNFQYARKEAILDKIRHMHLTATEIAMLDIEVARITANLKEIDAKRTYMVTGIEIMPEMQPKPLEWHFKMEKAKPVKVDRNLIVIRHTSELLEKKEETISRLASKCAHLAESLKKEQALNNRKRRKSPTRILNQ